VPAAVDAKRRELHREAERIAIDFLQQAAAHADRDERRDRVEVHPAPWSTRSNGEDGGALRVVARAERGGERTDARHDDRRIARIGPHDDATAGGDDLLAQRFAELDVDR